MAFEDYLDLREGMSALDKRLSLAFGLSPALLFLSYMTPAAFSFESNRAASVAPGLMLVGALSATAAVKCLLKKGPMRFAPHIDQIDLFTQKVRRHYYPLGMRGPWMRLKKAVVLRYFRGRMKRKQKEGSGHD